MMIAVDKSEAVSEESLSNCNQPLCPTARLHELSVSIIRIIEKVGRGRTGNDKKLRL
jgi:hypothetical protein